MVNNPFYAIVRSTFDNGIETAKETEYYFHTKDAALKAFDKIIARMPINITCTKVDESEYHLSDKEFSLHRFVKLKIVKATDKEIYTRDHTRREF